MLSATHIVRAPRAAISPEKPPGSAISDPTIELSNGGFPHSKIVLLMLFLMNTHSVNLLNIPAVVYIKYLEVPKIDFILFIHKLSQHVIV